MGLIKGTNMIFRLREMREVKKLSQNQLARICDMSVTNVQKYEQGRSRTIPFETLEMFCKILECLPGDLIVLGDAETYLKEQADRVQKKPNKFKKVEDVKSEKS